MALPMTAKPDFTPTWIARGIPPKDMTGWIWTPDETPAPDETTPDPDELLPEPAEAWTEAENREAFGR